MSFFRHHLSGGMDQHIETMRAVWPADKPSDHVSPPDRQPLRRGVDAVTQSKGVRGDGEREMMVERRQQRNPR